MEIPWGEIGKYAAIVLGPLTPFLQKLSKEARRRASIKALETDAKLLKALEKEQPGYNVLADHIAREVTRLYSPPPQATEVEVPPEPPKTGWSGFKQRFARNAFKGGWGDNLMSIGGLGEALIGCYLLIKNQTGTGLFYLSLGCLLVGFNVFMNVRFAERRFPLLGLGKAFREKDEEIKKLNAELTRGIIELRKKADAYDELVEKGLIPPAISAPPPPPQTTPSAT